MIDVFLETGPIAWALVACSLLAMTVALERGLFWGRLARSRDRGARASVRARVEEGALAEAARLAEASRDPALRMLRPGLRAGTRDRAGAVELEGRRLVERARRGLGLLDTVVTAAPLLGILGTVAGVIDVFRSLGAEGIRDAAQMEAVMAGIGQALVTTAAGLTVAIPALLVHNALASLVRRHALELEAEARPLEELAGRPGSRAASGDGPGRKGEHAAA